MAEQQKIHPVDVEAPPSAPLIPSDATKSDKGDPVESYPPPIHRTIPLNQSKPPKRKRSCCCKCICWTISLLLLLVVIIAATLGILYLIFQPKIPKYSIDHFEVSNFTLNTDESLFAEFTVRITTRNPNKKIGIYYEKGSKINVYYNDIELCQGSLPKFYQGHRNTTVLDVMLSGQTANATSLRNTLTAQENETGNVPLELKARVPVRVKLGKLKLMKIKFHVKCNLVVDSLTSSSSISIKNSSCKFSLKL